jgi:hypothetical protein
MPDLQVFQWIPIRPDFLALHFSMFRTTGWQKATVTNTVSECVLRWRISGMRMCVSVCVCGAQIGWDRIDVSFLTSGTKQIPPALYPCLCVSRSRDLICSAEIGKRERRRTIGFAVKERSRQRESGTSIHVV